MQTEPLYNWPAGARKAVALAHERGWTTRVTWADGPPQNVAVRFFRDDASPAYAVWEGSRFGFARRKDMTPLKSGSLLAYLENPHGDNTDSGRESGGLESADVGDDAAG